MNVNEENRCIRKAARFCVTNETREPVSGFIKWSIQDAASDICRQGQYSVEVEALSVNSYPWIEFPDIDIRNHYLSYELWLHGAKVSHGVSLFAVSYTHLDVYKRQDRGCVLH